MWIASQLGELSVFKLTTFCKLKLFYSICKTPHTHKDRKSFIKIKLSEETYNDKKEQNQSLVWQPNSCPGLQLSASSNTGSLWITVLFILSRLNVIQNRTKHAFFLTRAIVFSTCGTY